MNISLAWIAKDLHAAISTTQWIISEYLLALALILPLNGWLVDRTGAKKLYILCFSAFTFSSFVCGEARTMNRLILGRIIQSIAGGASRSADSVHVENKLPQTPQFSVKR